MSNLISNNGSCLNIYFDQYYLAYFFKAETSKCFSGVISYTHNAAIRQSITVIILQVRKLGIENYLPCVRNTEGDPAKFKPRSLLNASILNIFITNKTKPFIERIRWHL